MSSHMPLQPEELKSLQKLNRAGSLRRIRAEHGEKFVREGLAERQEGSLSITTLGRAEIAMAVTRAQWFSAHAR